jgi:hypothetical protein
MTDRLQHSSKGPQFYPRSLVFYITPDGTINDPATLVREQEFSGGLNSDAERFARIGHHSPEYPLAPALGFTNAYLPAGTHTIFISDTASPGQCLQPHLTTRTVNL